MKQYDGDKKESETKGDVIEQFRDVGSDRSEIVSSSRVLRMA